MSERAEKTRIDIGHALHSCVIAVSICNVGVLYVRKLALGLLCTLARGKPFFTIIAYARCIIWSLAYCMRLSASSNFVENLRSSSLLPQGEIDATAAGV